MAPDRPPKVFISYSRDSPAHLDRVRELVDRLILDGLECVLDQYQHPPPPQGWPRWMLEEVRGSDFVLVVCTEGYVQKVAARGASGVVFESAQVLQGLYETGLWNERVLPVLLAGAGPEWIWEPLRGYHYYQPGSEEGYEELYRRLTGQPALVRPTRGPLKHLPPLGLQAAPSLESHPEHPVWAKSLGEDPYGWWADLEVTEVVHRLRWIQAGTFQQFLAKPAELAPGLGARLPTEAEWEFACRAGTQTATWAGNLTVQDDAAPELEPIAWYEANSDGKTRLVKKKAPNPWGLYDMLGNVWEWCADWYGPYPAGDAIDPRGPLTGTDRVGRGGSSVARARSVRAAARNSGAPSDCYANRAPLTAGETGGGRPSTRRRLRTRRARRRP